MIATDLPATNFQNAARSLLKKPEWRQLYQHKEDVERMSLVIENQASDKRQ